MNITTPHKKIPSCLVAGLIVFIATGVYGETADAFLEESDAIIAGLDELDEWEGLYEWERLSSYDQTVSFSMGGGYSDNIILEEAKVGSAYVRPAFDLYGTYLPKGSSWVFSIFEYGEGRFFEEKSLKDEYLSLTQISAARELDGWRLGLELSNIYSRQVVDVSDSIYGEGGLFTLDEPQFRVSIGSDLGERLWVESMVAIAHAGYAVGENNHWRGSYEVRGGYGFERGGEVEVYVLYERERYDEKVSKYSSGLNLETEALLELSSVRLGIDYRKVIEGNWELRTRVWAERERDEVGAYYDQWKGEVRQMISWERGRWKVEVEGRAYAGKYDERFAMISEKVLGENGVISIERREERQWRRRWGWQVTCGYDLSDRMKLEGKVEDEAMRSNQEGLGYRSLGYEMKMEYSF